MENKGPISRRLKTLLANYLAKQSILREIEDAFEGANVPHVSDPAAIGGQRRQMVGGATTTALTGKPPMTFVNSWTPCGPS